MALTPSPNSILGRAIKAVPAVKYALGVAGVVSVVAIVVGGWKIDPRVAVFGFIIMILLMTILAVFSRITVIGPGLATPSIVLVWASVLIFIATALALFLSVFFDWPVPLRTRVFPRSDEKVQIIRDPSANSNRHDAGSDSAAGVGKSWAGAPRPSKTNHSEPGDMRASKKDEADGLITITVKDEKDVPIKGAQIAFCGGSFDSDKRTDSQGALAFQAHNRTSICPITVQADCCLATEDSIKPEESTKIIHMVRQKAN